MILLCVYRYNVRIIIMANVSVWVVEQYIMIENVDISMYYQLYIMVDEYNN